MMRLIETRGVGVSPSLFRMSFRPPLPISLSRDTRYECTPSPFLSFSLFAFYRFSSANFSVLIVIHLVSYFARTANFFLWRGLRGHDRGYSRQCRHATAVGPVDKFSSRMSGRTWGPSYDRILNRDDLDDAFECIPTGARLFIARRSYLVLELILGANNVGNKVPHPVQRPTSLLTCLYFYRIYLMYIFIPAFL